MSTQTEIAPNDLDAEMAYLACLLHGPDDPDKATANLSGDDFYAAANAILFGVCCSTARLHKTIDAVLVLAEADRLGVLERVGGKESLGKIAASVTSSVNVDHYAGIIRECSLKRRLLSVAGSIRDAVSRGDRGEVSLSRAQQEIRDLDESYQVTGASTKLFRTMAEIKAAGSLEIPWLAKGFLVSGGITLVSGLMKGGKSTWLYAMLAAIERGDADFCGQPILKPGTPSILITEEPEFAIADKWDRLGMNNGRHLLYTPSVDYPRLSIEKIVSHALAARVAAGGEHGILVLDTLRHFGQFEAGGENDNSTVQAAIAPLKRAAAAGLSVVILHHMKKAGGEEGTASAGAGALLGGVEIGIELRRFGSGQGGKDTTQRAMKFYGRCGVLPETVIDYDEATGQYHAIGDAENAREGAKIRKVADTLARIHRWATTEEVAELTGFRLRAVKDTLQAAVIAQAVRRINSGLRGNPYLYAALDVEYPQNHAC